MSIKLSFQMEERILLFTENKVYWLKPNDICALKANRSYTDVKLYDGSSIKVSKNLKMLLNSHFKNATQFYRVQKSYVVNINHIEYLYMNGPSKTMLRLTNGLDIPISNDGIRKQLFRAYGQQEDIESIVKSRFIKLNNIVHIHASSPNQSTKQSTQSHNSEEYIIVS